MNGRHDPSDDDQRLRQLGYQPELARRMSGFSNLAISLSIICILSGGITSFHLGFCSVGGAAIGIGESLGRFLPGRCRVVEDLQGHMPFQGGLMGEEHHRGASLAKALFEGVSKHRRA